ncbi:MAG: hypothetical protein WC091_17070 [Sulfuricellaceae bacterium]
MFGGTEAPTPAVSGHPPARGQRAQPQQTAGGNENFPDVGRRPLFLFDWKIMALRAEYTARPTIPAIPGKKPVNIANAYNPPRFNRSRKAQQPTGIGRIFTAATRNISSKPI